MVDENTSNDQKQDDQSSSSQDNSSQQSQDDKQQSQQSQDQQTQGDQSSPTQSLSDEQVASLKESITKDVSGQVSKDVSKSVIAKIGEALGLTKKEEEKLPTDAEALQKIVADKVKEGIEAFKTEQKTETAQGEKNYQEKVKEIQIGWFTQYDLLAKSGKVPVIKDSNSVNDPGVLARRRIILAIGTEIEKLRGDGSNYIPSISDILVNNPQILSGPPGDNLPISGNTNATEEPFSNKDIREKSMAQIASEGVS